MRCTVWMLGVFLWMTVAHGGQTIRYWYHVDNPTTDPIPGLVRDFQQLHPDITVRAESMPWDTYYDNLHTSIVGGNPPDAAMVGLMAMTRFQDMDALEPLDPYIAAWPGKSDILDDLWSRLEADDTKTYLLPLHYVAFFLYIRRDLFEKHHVPIPATQDEFLAAAQALTLDQDNDGSPETYGFGFLGGRGGHEQWGVFVLPNARGVTPEQLRDPWVEQANQFVVDMYRTHAVMPPTAPQDGLEEILRAFQSGKTAMTIHHIGSSKAMVEVLGDQVDAVPVPRCGKNGEGWTHLSDEENAIFTHSENKDAAWAWISFLATGEYNSRLAAATGQLPVTKSASAAWNRHEKRFMEVTLASLPFASTLPLLPQTEEFVNSVWPREMQRALLGESTSPNMLRAIDQLFNE